MDTRWCPDVGHGLSGISLLASVAWACSSRQVQHWHALWALLLAALFEGAQVHFACLAHVDQDTADTAGCFNICLVTGRKSACPCRWKRARGSACPCCWKPTRG
eukprot:1157317-Pelagomonas_calceolata.AAC.10